MDPLSQATLGAAAAQSVIKKADLARIGLIGGLAGEHKLQHIPSPAQAEGLAADEDLGLTDGLLSWHTSPRSQRRSARR